MNPNELEYDDTFYDLHDTIPFHTNDKDTKHQHVYTFTNHPSVRIKSPGKYSDVTNGGDFVVEVYGEIGTGPKFRTGWSQPKHSDLIRYTTESPVDKSRFFAEWKSMLLDTPIYALDLADDYERTLMYVLQLIGVCEFRRYPQSEPVGGRFLLYNFAYGCTFHGWPIHEAYGKITRGKPGLYDMRERYGMRLVSA